MQFGFMSGKGTTDTIFISTRETSSKEKAVVDLEKESDKETPERW